MCVGHLSRRHILCCYPSLLSHPGIWGTCSWLLWGTGGAAASPPTEMLAGGTLRPRKWETLLASTMWWVLVQWPGLLYADLEGILGGECTTSSSCQNLRTRGSLHRAELVLSSASQPAQIQLVAGRSGPNLAGAEVSSWGHGMGCRACAAYVAHDMEHLHVSHHLLKMRPSSWSHPTSPRDSHKSFKCGPWLSFPGMYWPFCHAWAWLRWLEDKHF